MSTSLDTPFDPPPPPTPPTGHGLLDDKVVIVTAAAGTGIGSATARRCLEEGAAVIISDAHERRLAETAEQLAAAAGATPAGAGEERVHAIACNVTDEAQVQALYDGAIAHFGRIDVAVHNAGLGGTVPLVEMTDEQWSTVLDITLTGTFRCTRAAMTHLLPQRSGVIVNNASVLGSASPAGPGPLRRGQSQCSSGRSALGRIRAVTKISVPAGKADSPVTATATWSVCPSSRVSMGRCRESPPPAAPMDGAFVELRLGGRQVVKESHPASFDRPPCLRNRINPRRGARS